MTVIYLLDLLFPLLVPGVIATVTAALILLGHHTDDDLRYEARRTKR